MKVRIVEVKAPCRECKKYYKIQTSCLGFIWDDEVDGEYGMIYPTFETLEDARKYVSDVYFEKETVIEEYNIV